MNYLRGVKHLIPISLRIIHFIFLFLKVGKGKGSPSNDLIRYGHSRSVLLVNGYALVQCFRMYLTDVLCQDRAGESSGQHPVRCHRGGRGGLPGHRRHHEGQDPPITSISF